MTIAIKVDIIKANSLLKIVQVHPNLPEVMLILQKEQVTKK